MKMPEAFKPVMRSVFSPLLLDSEPLEVSEEQKMYIRKVLTTTSSDQQFADKAYLAIEKILTGGSVKPPVIDSLSPSSAVIGEPYFDMHVIGSEFTPESKIVFNGFEEPTTFNSPTDISTGINMPLWLAPAVVPVFVSNANGAASAPKDFTFSEAGASGQDFNSIPDDEKPWTKPTVPNAEAENT